MNYEPPYELTDTQKKFVSKARKNGLKIRWDYSGRGMYGARCPAVIVGHPSDFSFKHSNVDNMGLDYVVYCRG